MKIFHRHPLILSSLTIVFAVSCGAIEAGKAMLGYRERGTTSDSRSSYPASDQSIDLNGSYLTVEKYTNCEELKSDLRGNLNLLLRLNWNQALYNRANPPTYSDNGVSQAQSASSPAPMGQEASPGALGKSAREIGTNVQVVGVDESDDIKISDKAIYIAENQINRNAFSIAVVGTDPLRNLGSIDVPGLISPRLFIQNDLLVVTGIKSGANSNALSTSQSQYIIRTYNVKSPDNPKLLYSTDLSASPMDARIVNGKLVVVDRKSVV